MVLEEIILIVVLKNVSKNRSVKKNKGDLGEICVPNNVNVCMLNYSWFLRLSEPSKQEKQKEEQWKPWFLSEPRSILFSCRIMSQGSCWENLKKSVMHVLWNDHYQLRHTKDTYKEFYIMDKL